MVLPRVGTWLLHHHFLGLACAFFALLPSIWLCNQGRHFLGGLRGSALGGRLAKREYSSDEDDQGNLYLNTALPSKNPS
jgi:hypothetical protein